MMRSKCIIYTPNHSFGRLDIAMYKQRFEETRPVKIGNDLWISARVTILPGVTIEDCTIIGAGSVVNKNVLKFSIVRGVPAKVIKFR